MRDAGIGLVLTGVMVGVTWAIWDLSVVLATAAFGVHLRRTDGDRDRGRRHPVGVLADGLERRPDRREDRVERDRERGLDVRDSDTLRRLPPFGRPWTLRA